MSDRALRELLTSPLDDEPRRMAPRVRTALGLAAGLVVGALAGGAIAALAGDDPLAESAPTETTTIPAAGPVPLGGELAAEAAWVMTRGDSLFIGVHILAMPGVTTSETPGTAAWALRLDDGQLIPFRAEHAAFVADGVVTIEFPARGIDPRDLDTLVMRPSTGATELTGIWEVEVAELPWRGPPPGPIVAGDGFSLVASEVHIADDGGVVEWQLLGATGRRAVLDVEATWVEPGTDGLQVAAPEYRIGDTPLQISPVQEGAGSSGTIDLYHLDDPDTPSFRSRWWGDPGPVAIDGLTLVFRVTVYDYADDGIELPLAELPVMVG